jgi:hypothetical protein
MATLIWADPDSGLSRPFSSPAVRSKYARENNDGLLRITRLAQVKSLILLLILSLQVRRLSFESRHAVMDHIS